MGMIGEHGSGFVGLAKLNLYFRLHYFCSTDMLVTRSGSDLVNLFTKSLPKRNLQLSSASLFS